MRVTCLCGCVLATVNDGTAREMAGLCEHCLKTNDCTTSPHWKYGKGVPNTQKRNLKERV